MIYDLLTESYFSPWKAVLSYFLKDYGGDFIFVAILNLPISRTTTSQDFIAIV